MRKISKTDNVKKANIIAESLYKQRNNENFGQDNDIISDLLNQNDGPVDEFVIISRGVKLAASGLNPKEVSNAMYQALKTVKDTGTLGSNEMPRSGV